MLEEVNRGRILESFYTFFFKSCSGYCFNENLVHNISLIMCIHYWKTDLYSLEVELRFCFVHSMYTIDQYVLKGVTCDVNFRGGNVKLSRQYTVR